LLYLCYDKGLGTTANRKLALEQLNKSASNGYYEAINKIAQIRGDEEAKLLAIEKAQQERKKQLEAEKMAEQERIKTSATQSSKKTYKISAWDRFCHGWKDYWDNYFKNQRHRTLFFISPVGLNYSETDAYKELGLSFLDIYKEVDSSFGITIFPLELTYGILPNIFLGVSAEIGKPYTSITGVTGLNFTVVKHVNLFALAGYGIDAFPFMSSDFDAVKENSARLGAGFDFWGDNSCGGTFEYSLDYITDVGFVDRYYLGFTFYFDEHIFGFLQEYENNYRTR